MICLAILLAGSTYSWCCTMQFDSVYCFPPMLSCCFYHWLEPTPVSTMLTCSPGNLSASRRSRSIIILTPHAWHHDR